MASIKVQHTHFIVLLILLSLTVTETRRDGDNGFDLGPIIYPNDDLLTRPYLRSAASEDTRTNTEYDIPASLIEAMNKIDDPDELFNKYFIGNDADRPHARINIAGIGSRFGKSGEARGEVPNIGNFVQHPRMPLCEPRLTPVHLAAPKPGVLLEPSCLMVPRCGPCCRFGMKCIPVSTETFVYSVQEAKYVPDAERFLLTGRRNVSEEHHTSCKCECGVKPQDCQRMTKAFDKTSCKCVCQQERYNTFVCSVRGRQWNSDACTCDCRQLTCDEGYFFNNETCKCDF